MGGFFNWFSTWWSGLDMIEQILYCIAIPATFFLLIETVLMIIGGDHGDGGVHPSDTSGIDFDGDTDIGGFHFDGDGCPGDIHVGDIHTDVSGHDFDVHHDGDVHDVGAPTDMPTLKLFTVQGTVAFLTVFGWVALICYHNGLPVPVALLIAFTAGFLVMYLMAKLFQSFKRLVENGTLDYKNALGAEGTVYIPIPPKSKGSGKVNIIIQGSLRECEAVNDGSELIPTGAVVRVIDVVGDTLVVEKSL